MATRSNRSTQSAQATPAQAIDVEATEATEATSAKVAAPVRTGRLNPLSLVMRVMIGKADQVTKEEQAVFAQFITGEIRLTDTHVSAMAKFASKQNHTAYTRLALKVAAQLAHEADNPSLLPQFRAEIEQATGVKCSDRDAIEGTYSDLYKEYSIDLVDSARSWLWDCYGKTGSLNAGLIDRASERAKMERSAPMQS